MDLKKYLEKNSLGEPAYASPTDRTHGSLINSAILQPKKFSINDNATFYREVKLMENGIEIGRVDLVAHTLDELVVVEAKSISNRGPKSYSRSKDKSNLQLSRAYRYFMQHFGTQPRMIGLYFISASKDIYSYQLKKSI